MEAIFGPTILKMSYQDSVDAGMVVPMKYVMVPCGWCPQFLREREGLSDVVLKRYSYWANKARNKAIASIVKDVWFNTDAQVLIMCATLEHAVYLHMLMPWMVVAYYGSVDMAKLREMFPKSKYPDLDVSKYKVTTKQLDITRRAFAKGTLRGVISTYVFRQGVNFRHLKVLVRADGATSTVAGIQIPGRLSRLDEGKDCAYLIDVRDTFTDWAVRRSETRAKLYQEQGWKEITREELLNDLRTEPDDKPDDTAGSCSTET
jgi:superfamily II DNA or RNA helicase